MITIGNISKFAIQISYISAINNFVIGRNIIWIENMFIGFYDEESPVGPLLNSIRNINLFRCQNIIDCNIKLNVTRYFYLGKTIYPGESFDDFEIKIIKTKEFIHFIWRLKKQPNNRIDE